jgi:hypothetical protein
MQIDPVTSIQIELLENTITSNLVVMSANSAMSLINGSS